MFDIKYIDFTKIEVSDIGELNPDISADEKQQESLNQLTPKKTARDHLYVPNKDKVPLELRGFNVADDSLFGFDVKYKERAKKTGRLFYNMLYNIFNNIQHSIKSTLKKNQKKERS